MKRFCISVLLIALALLCLGLFFPAGETYAVTPHVASTSPTTNDLDVSVDTDISVTFDTDMDSLTIDNSTVIVNARYTGLHQGTIHYDTLTRTATLDLSDDFKEGEVVTVVLTTGIRSSGGDPLGKSFIWSFTTQAGSGTGAFPSYTDYPVGDTPYWILAGDLDGDGDLDLAVASMGSNGVSVLLNNGNGTFAAHSIYSTGTISLPSSVYAADLDGDGDLDLATSNSANDSVAVLLNNGNGTFASPSNYSVGSNPQSIFAADLDGDGDLDLTTGNIDADSISVLLNNGDGTFSSRSDYAIGTQPYSVFVADLDGDHDLDVTSANYEGNVSVLRNSGNGTFSSHSVYAAGFLPHSAFAGDLDGDGDIDLATANFGTFNGEVSVLLNNGGGSFPSHTEYAVGTLAMAVFAGDLDGDGDLDIVTANSGDNNVSVLMNNGGGTFAAHSDYSIVVNPPASVFAADFNGDGSLDLATANQSSNNISVLLNGSSDVQEDETAPDLPQALAMKQNYPNPFNPVTVIDYHLKKRSRVELVVYNLLGEKVKTVVDEEEPRGNHSAIWDGTDDSGSRVASGAYLYRLKVEDSVVSKKMILLK